jgi:hypothetical protein
MVHGAKKTSLYGVLYLFILSFLLIFVPVALAADYEIYDNPTGGACTAIGSWDSASKTCTLGRDIEVNGITDGIRINNNNITLDGAGHRVFFTGTVSTQYGVWIQSSTGCTVRNLTLQGFNTGIGVWSNNNSVLANTLLLNEYGIYALNSDSSQYGFNTLVNNTIEGFLFTNSDSNTIRFNNVLSNTNQARVDGTSVNNNFSSNYWNDFDSRPEGCVNVAPFDAACDGPYLFNGDSDAAALVLIDFVFRYDWTWYDDIGGDNWVLLANRPQNPSNMLFKLSIAGTEYPLTSIQGLPPGYVPPGSTIYNKYPGLMGGPVKAINMNLFERAITSQRVLWPKGGDSLEELPGQIFEQFNSKLYWTWYDMASPGFKNWILISNLNDYQINYDIRIAGNLVDAGTIPANGRVTPSFPGVIGGPVEVNAWNSFGDPVFIMGSQRVLSNGDTAFNEQPGLSSQMLSDHYVWTWYDEASPSAQNWVLVANPPGSASNIWYEVWIGGVKVRDAGPIVPGANETPTFPGMIGGPVEVKSFSDAAHTLPANSIASQRIIWGPSFGEVLGRANGTLGNLHHWTWYDEQSPGARNWVLVANPPGAAGPIYYEVWIGGSKVRDGGPIAPGGNDTPTFPGVMGGPVQVRTYSDPAHTVIAPSIVTQRVLWNGYFNEVWGQ